MFFVEANLTCLTIEFYNAVSFGFLGVFWAIFRGVIRSITEKAFFGILLALRGFCYSAISCFDRVFHFACRVMPSGSSHFRKIVQVALF